MRSVDRGDQNFVRRVLARCNPSDRRLPARAPVAAFTGGHSAVVAATVALSLTLPLPAPAAMAPDAPALADLSLEQLSEVVITTVSRREETLDRAAASVFVITNDDIRRSGATTIPEALRLAPSLDVARADANQYAVSARGFANVLANRMLVLIDGRIVYSPLFSGVFWEVQDVMLEDVDRIEVVSGPSTALWGTNAVNGLIHIITKAAGATQGAAVSTSFGEHDSMAAARYGGAAGEWRWRGYAKTYARGHTTLTSGAPVRDEADGTQGGFRADGALAGGALTLQGDAYGASIDQLPAARSLSGANLLARWQRAIDRGWQVTLQGYVDHTLRDQPGAIRESLQTYDLVAQVGGVLGERHRVLFGTGLRTAHDHVTNRAVGFIPPSRSLDWQRLFAIDQVALSERLELTLAASVERNPYTGWETLPDVRLAWRPRNEMLLWGSLSRAVRAPSRVDREFFQPVQPPFVLAGGPEFESEVSNVVQLGVRAQATRTLSVSATLFQHEHDRLRSLAPTPAGLQFQNGNTGRTRGLQAWAQWRAMERWRLTAGGVWLHQDLHPEAGVVAIGGTQALGNDPNHRWSVRSSLELGHGVDWELAVRHVGGRPNPLVPSYTAVDTRLAWRLPHDVELALVGYNLFDPEHTEWGVPTNSAELRRAVWLQARWGL